MRTPEQHAKRIAKLYLLRVRAARQLALVGAYLDAALIAARRDNAPYADLGDELLAATGSPRTAEALARIENSLRVATHAATYRRRQRISTANEAPGDEAPRACEIPRVRMLRKRVTEYWIDDSVEAGGLNGVDLSDLDLEGLDRLDARDPGEVEQEVEQEDEHAHASCGRTCEVGAHANRKDR